MPPRYPDQRSRLAMVRCSPGWPESNSGWPRPMRPGWATSLSVISATLGAGLVGSLGTRFWPSAIKGLLCPGLSHEAVLS